MPHKKLIAIDFDGVLHSYTSPWTDAATISDPPTPGAMEFLRAVHTDPRFEVCVVSSRCRDESGKISIERWLYRHLDEAFGKEGRILAEDISVRSERPPAFLTIDDRGWNFDGTWPDLDAMAAFKPWNKRPVVEAAPESFELWRTDPERPGIISIDMNVLGRPLTPQDLETIAALQRQRQEEIGFKPGYGVLPSQPFTTPMPKVKPPKRADPSPDLLREVARRAYVAGCEAVEFHEEDCQEEVQGILDDVLGRKVTA